ncbi:MAG: D-alanyl-D-alanine carboxypeptidase/D-alanyl-D-alanine-endopeptidase [Thiobacillus sp. 65-29]|nr:MAG: D-alanyl-D-alanine carboxypeptidase/D-alanyl-D-alanine-endopeptidase [Thiobacillus sp. 65-29]
MPVAAAFRLLAGLLLVALALGARGAELPVPVVAALAEAGIPLSRVAVVVQPLGTSEALLSHNADAALNPASTMKLVTSFAALDLLGPSYTWTTTLWAAGPLAGGVLDGDLVIKGRGDPTLTLERMWLLQRELRARGVQHIRGGLVLDTAYFSVPEHDPAAFDGEPFAPYNAAPGALVANFNAVALRVKPQDDAVLIVPDLVLPGVTLVSRVTLAEAVECNGGQGALVPAFPDEARRTLEITGRYPRDCGERALAFNLFEPAATFDFIFRGLWDEAGGTLAGATRGGTAPDATPLLVFESEPLAQALTRLNKYSSNIMARNLFLTLGAEAFGAPGTPDKGARAVRDSLARYGISTQKLVLENGAGLSRIERVSAQALTALLHAAQRTPWAAEFAASLPLAAQDGTLKRRFAGSAVAGRAHLKTGTLRDVSALAGYVHTLRGDSVSVVMLVNHPRARASEAAQRALLEWVVAQ